MSTNTLNKKEARKGWWLIISLLINVWCPANFISPLKVNWLGESQMPLHLVNLISKVAFGNSKFNPTTSIKSRLWSHKAKTNRYLCPLVSKLPLLIVNCGWIRSLLQLLIFALSILMISLYLAANGPTHQALKGFVWASPTNWAYAIHYKMLL